MNEGKLEILAGYLNINEENYDKFIEEVSVNDNIFEYDFEDYYILSSNELYNIEKDFIKLDIEEILLELKRLVPNALNYFDKESYIFDHTNTYDPETLANKDLLYSDENYYIFQE